MKYIIVGLGNFGASLSSELTASGHEVIGVDNNMSKIDALKDIITHTVCMDATDMTAMQTLPFKDTDVVVVAIGEDFGSNVMVTAIAKQMRARRIISRAISPLHRTVIDAIGVDEIVQPETESAERLAKRLDMTGVINSFGLSEEHTIIEAEVPKRYIGNTIEQADLRGKYNVNVLTIKKMVEGKNILGNRHIKAKVVDVLTPQTMLEQGDILVIFGRTEDIHRMLEKK